MVVLCCTVGHFALDGNVALSAILFPGRLFEIRLFVVLLLAAVYGSGFIQA